MMVNPFFQSEPDIGQLWFNKKNRFVIRIAQVKSEKLYYELLNSTKPDPGQISGETLKKDWELISEHSYEAFWALDYEKKIIDNKSDELPCQDFIEVISEYDKFVAYFKFGNGKKPCSQKSKYHDDTTIVELLVRAARNWGWCVDNKASILEIDSSKECPEIQELIQELKKAACIDRIPAIYREPTEVYWKNNKNTRDRFAKEQDNLCWHCEEPLKDLPRKNLRKYKYRSWFKQGVSDIVLHHCHKTDYAFGTVHSLCNQILARCENE